MLAPTKFMGTLRAKLGLIYEFKKLVYVYEELPQSHGARNIWRLFKINWRTQKTHLEVLQPHFASKNGGFHHC